MVTNKIQKLREYQRQMEKLQKELSGFNRKLLALPGKFGFKSMNDFIDALRSASGAKASAKSAATKAGGRKPRAKITADMKAKVKTMVAGGKTGSEIAAALNISLPSVQNIKKELGLVKKRG